MSGRIKLPFKLGDSKKINEIEITETLKKEDFSLSEVRIQFSRYLEEFLFNIRLYDMVFPIDQRHWHMIQYKKFLQLELKMELLKCKF
jgi:hypothetical protein